MPTTKYAINAVQVAGLGLVFPGTLFSDQYDDLTRLANAGVLLWPSSDATVAAAAAAVNAKRSTGIAPEDAQGLMLAAVSSSNSTAAAAALAAAVAAQATADAGIGVVKRTVTIGHADLTDAVAGEAQVINIGAVLPANAVVLAHEVNVATLFSGGSVSAVKLDVGGTDADAIVSQMDLFTGAATGALSPRTGVHAQGKFSAEQLIATFTPDGGHTLLALTAGSVTITVWYFVLA